MKQDKWLVLGANSYRAEVRDSRGAKRMKNKYQLNVCEHVEWGYVDRLSLILLLLLGLMGRLVFLLVIMTCIVVSI